METTEVFACRSCLIDKGRLEKLGPATLKTYSAITGLPVIEGDGFPIYFCFECRIQIKKAIAFRRKAKRAHFVLKEIMVVKKQITLNYINEVNRQKTNLKTSIGLWKQKCNYIVNIEERESLFISTIDLCNDSKATSIDYIEYKFNPIIDGVGVYHVVEIPPLKKQFHSVSDSNVINLISNVIINPHSYNAKVKMIQPKLDLADCDLTDLKNDNQDNDNQDNDNQDNDNQDNDNQDNDNQDNDNQDNDNQDNDNQDNDNQDNDNQDNDNQDNDNQDNDNQDNDNQDNDNQDNDNIYFLNDVSTQDYEIKINKKLSLQDLGNIFNKDIDNIAANEEVEDIDDIELEDTSKDMKRKFAEDEGLKQPPEVKKKNRLLNVIQIQARILTHCNLLSLTLDEQKKAYQLRLNNSTYLNAQHKCSVCLKIFNSLNELLYHTTIHSSSNDNYVCRVCKMKFDEFNKLFQHKALTHIYKYECTLCSKAEFCLSDIVEHFKTLHSEVTKKEYELFSSNFIMKKISPQEIHETIKYPTFPNKTFRCDLCNIGFRKKTELNFHNMHHKQTEERNFMCDVCTIYLPSTKLLERHIYKYHCFHYTCRTCQNVSYNESQAREHFNVHLIAKSCLLCPYKTKIYNGIQRHMIKWHPSAVEKYCQICGGSFENLQAMYFHQLTHHKYISVNIEEKCLPELNCDICNVQFWSKKALDYHISLRHKISNQTVTCGFCQSVYPSNKEYYNHYNIVHKDDLSCFYCDVQLTHKKERWSHHKKFHKNDAYLHSIENISKTLCELCGAKVVSLKSHMLSHEADCSITCKYCLTKQASPSVYTLHVLRYHTQHPYRCAICQLKYRRIDQLNRHILKVHQPVRPYKCDVCDCTFAIFEYLNKHAKEVHSIHDLKPIALFKSYKWNKTVCFYPHMKINCSLVPEEILEMTTFNLINYVDRTVEKVDNYKDYVITDANLLKFLDEERAKVTFPKSKKGTLTAMPAITGNKSKSLDISETERACKEIMNIDRHDSSDEEEEYCDDEEEYEYQKIGDDTDGVFQKKFIEDPVTKEKKTLWNFVGSADTSDDLHAKRARYDISLKEDYEDTSDQIEDTGYNNKYDTTCVATTNYTSDKTKQNSVDEILDSNCGEITNDECSQSMEVSEENDDSDSEILDNIEKPLEVINIGNEQYVMIKQILYKIETV